jgi:hypothetical protein
MNISIDLRRLLMTALALLALPVAIQAQFSYVTNSDAVSITITGYTGPGGAVVIPDTINGYPVTGIGSQAFQSDSVTSVIIPNSVTGIGDYAFRYCSGLTNVTIPDGVTSIGQNAFLFCTSLPSVTIPGTVKNLGINAFGGCQNLKNVTIANGVTDIGEQAFLGTGLTNIVLPNSVITIEGFAFFGCPATSLTLSSHLTNIETQAFWSCSNLTSVTIPPSVTIIGYRAFGRSTNLTAAYFLGNAPPNDGYAFVEDTKCVVYYLPGTTGWGPTFGGVPAVLWNPLATALAATAGQFAFNITGPTNATIVVAACTNLANPIWLPVSTNTLSSSGTSSFIDPQSPNYPYRFYRFRSP